jgi:hypothetical protein
MCRQEFGYRFHAQKTHSQERPGCRALLYVVNADTKHHQERAMVTAVTTVGAENDRRAVLPRRDVQWRFLVKRRRFAEPFENGA